MPFSDSCRLATIISRFASSSSFRSSARSRFSSAAGSSSENRAASSSCVVRSSCISSFFVSSRSVCDTLLGHNILASMPHFDSIVSLRVILLSFTWHRDRIQLAANNVPAFLCRACCRRSAATALLLRIHSARCRSDSADLPSSRRTTCTILQLLPDVQLSGVRLRTRARFQYFQALRFSIAYRTPSPSPRGTFSSLTTLARPTSCEVNTARALPPLPVLPSGFVPSVSDTHCYLLPNSSDQLVNLVPTTFLSSSGPPNVVFSWYPLHLYSS